MLSAADTIEELLLRGEPDQSGVPERVREAANSGDRRLIAATPSCWHESTESSPH